jgi:Fe-S-cluster-containing dehydrogenase component/DMSO reductase anchor subunit
MEGAGPRGGSGVSTLPLFESELLRIGGTVSLRLEPAPVRQPLIPDRKPAPGEQYRFHFDMTKCIGCKCCVVACNEQNGNPAAINWRRVGEIEGGHYPYTQRHYLSMGCNHCLEPSCMIGCPVEAYTKDASTGVVLHSADTCIGCQYCTWNCSYGVPQYNPERGVVGKCDLCHNRLSDGMAPACASACPEGAIAIEIVDVSEWRGNYVSANAPGMPSADDSISTTRVTLPDDLPPDTGRVDTQQIEPEHPHWPLVFMLVLTQLSAGAFAVLWLLDAMGADANLSLSALALLAIAGVSLGASTLHLGRPVYAFRALKGLKRSWLSREVLSLSLFSGVAAAFAAMLLFDWPHREWVGLVTALFGAAGVTSSAQIYVVRARPAWFSAYTLAEFFSTAVFLGPLFALAVNVTGARWVLWAAIAGAAAQLSTQTMKFLWLSRSDVFELRASSLLLAGRFQRALLARLAILVVAPALALAGHAPPAFALALAGEWLGRWLFFVTVVPKNTAAAFLRTRRAA